MNVSVYIDVDYNEINHLYDIVIAYDKGTIKPNELVINISGVVDENDVNTLYEIQNLKIPYVKIYLSKTLIPKFKNRNYVRTLTTGDIIVFNKFNVIPHKDRINFIKKYFKNNNVYVLHHTFAYNIIDSNVQEYTITSDDLYKRYFPFNNKLGCWQYTRTYGVEFGVDNIDMESVVIRKHVLNDIIWKDTYQLELYKGNDNGMYYEFALDNLYTYKKSVILNYPLTFVNK